MQILQCFTSTVAMNKDLCSDYYQ